MEEDDACTVLSGLDGCDTLQTLVMSHVRLGDSAVQCLCAAEHHVVELNISATGISKEGLMSLAKATNGKLRVCGMGDGG